MDESENEPLGLINSYPTSPVFYSDENTNYGDDCFLGDYCENISYENNQNKYQEENKGCLSPSGCGNENTFLTGCFSQDLMSFNQPTYQYGVGLVDYPNYYDHQKMSTEGNGSSSITTDCNDDNDEDDEIIPLNIIRIKYMKKICCECKNAVQRTNAFILDKDEKYKNGKDKYICLDCSIRVIKDIYRLSDWEKDVELSPKLCYRCKRFKSSYRFKRANYCSYCSNKQKWGNKNRK